MNRLGVSKGDAVEFKDGDGISKGTVNGPVQIYENGELYVPVYVTDGDRCLVVHASNIIRRG